MACDFLCIDVAATHKVIVNSANLMDELFAALSKSYAVNPNLSTYATKVVCTLMKKNVVEV